MWDQLIVCYRLLDKKAVAQELVLARLKVGGGRRDAPPAVCCRCPGLSLHTPTTHPPAWLAPPAHTLLQVTPSDAKLWCALGDITGQAAHYSKAWEVSGLRSSRAQRSLGRCVVTHCCTDTVCAAQVSSLLERETAALFDDSSAHAPSVSSTHCHAANHATSPCRLLHPPDHHPCLPRPSGLLCARRSTPLPLPHTSWRWHSTPCTLTSGSHWGTPTSSWGRQPRRSRCVRCCCCCQCCCCL